MSGTRVSDFHLKADLPEGREDRVTVMAEAFKAALSHAQSDPETRLRMILGEAYARVVETVAWLRSEIMKEPGAVGELAEKFARDPELLLRNTEGDVGATQLKLLLLALKKDGRS